jgi:hypothetical protein
MILDWYPVGLDGYNLKSTARNGMHLKPLFLSLPTSQENLDNTIKQ